MESNITSSQGLSQKIEDNLIRFAESWRNKDWLRVTSTILGYWLICFSPFLLSEIAKNFTSFSLPKYLLWGWIAVAFVLFTVALVFAFRLKRPTLSPPINSVIRGLLPFERADADIFEKLGRSVPLSQSLTVLKSNSFRFGILHGASGCGKTSFLRAGLLPRLNKPDSAFRCVYVEFTNLDPLQTIREAITDELAPTEELPASSNLAALFNAATGSGRPLVLLFDQFEQVFFQRYQQLASDPFFLALTDWYKERNAHDHRILLCWRRDYYYQSTDLLQLLGGYIGFQDLFSLEKFTPEQASEVFRVMANEANLMFDSGFVNEMIRNELAEKETEEGVASLKVSPVSMQILAWLIAGQQASETRAFDRSAFREMGGVDGLMEQFLRRTLDGRGPKKQTDVKVLLALTNRDTRTRAGILSVDAILERDKTLSREDVDESLAYLGSPTDYSGDNR